MRINLNGLSVGQWRKLAEQELSELIQALEYTTSE